MQPSNGLTEVDNVLTYSSANLGTTLNDSIMRPKKTGASRLMKLTVLSVAAVIITGLGLLYVLDKALVASTVNKRNASATNYTPAQQTQAGTNKVETMFLNDSASKNDGGILGSGLSARDLNEGNINPSNARAALRSAPTESIQEAVKAKTGKSVSASNIERARTKALSSEGQQKINEAFKRRDEVDISTIREKLNR